MDTDETITVEGSLMGWNHCFRQCQWQETSWCCCIPAATRRVCSHGLKQKSILDYDTHEIRVLCALQCSRCHAPLAQAPESGCSIFVVTFIVSSKLEFTSNVVLLFFGGVGLGGWGREWGGVVWMLCGVSTILRVKKEVTSEQ